MFLDFRKVFKEEGARGWQVDQDGEGFYLSKYDDDLNDDEFRFYIGEEHGVLTLLVGVRRKSSGRVNPLRDNHPSFDQAASLIDAFNRKTRRLPVLKKEA